MDLFLVNHAKKISYLQENRDDLKWFDDNRHQKKRIRPVFDWELKQYGRDIVGAVVTKRRPKGLVKKFFGPDHALAKKLAASN